MIMDSNHYTLEDKDFLLSLSKDQLEAIHTEIVDTLPSKAPIYLPTERVNLIDKIIGLSHVRQIYKTDMDKIYRPRLRKLRDKYRNNSRCFLIGNGPSLNNTDLNALKDEVTFAVNSFFLKSRDLGWSPTFYLVEDHLVAEDRAHWINKLQGPIKLFPAYLGYAFPKSDDTIFYNHRPRKSFPDGFDFSLEADKITYTGCTVTFSMMQIAAYLGFKEINLIGVDASYEIPKDVNEGGQYAVGVLDMKSDDINHFDPNYFGKGFRWHDPQVNKMVEAYSEAKRVLSQTDQRIYNATVGGKLEVFERRDFNQILPHAASPELVSERNETLKKSKYPRLLILDMTPMGNGSATGEVKAELFNGWPNQSIMQIASGDGKRLVRVAPNKLHDSYEISNIEPFEAKELIDEFAPEVVLYRPVPNQHLLHKFSMQIVEDLDAPLITWIMDDWPQALLTEDDEESRALSEDLIPLLQRSEQRFSICNEMSRAYEDRYQLAFQPFANGVNPVDWPTLKHHNGGSLLIRYGGGLAENMTLESIQRVARVVEDLRVKGYNIDFEINTQKWWYQRYSHLFDGFKHTHIDCVSRTKDQYKNWLAESDVSLIAYNFDESTIRYVQYSMANKMPEVLASGSVVLAHGPKQIATINYLASTEAAIIVDQPSDQAVESALIALFDNPSHRNQLAYKGRTFAFDRHNLIDLREQIRDSIASVALSATINEKTTNQGPRNTPYKNNLSRYLELSPTVNLKTANKLLRNGQYKDAMNRYLYMWEKCIDPSLPLAQAYAFNALYSWRKLSGSSEPIKIHELSNKVRDDNN